MATREDYAKWLVDNADKRGTPEFQTVAEAYRKMSGTQEQPREATAEEMFMGSAPVRALLGASQILTGPFQLGANIGDKIAGAVGLEPTVGKAVNEGLSRIEQMKQRGMQARGNGGMDWAGLAGTLAAGGPLAKAGMTAATLPGRMAQGAKTGAAFGAATPVTGEGDFAQQKGLQTAMGGALGGVIPAATGAMGWAGRAVHNLAEPYLPGGMQRVAGRTLNAAAGPRQQAVIQELERNRQYVPGSQPTAGEAAVRARSAEFSGLQREVSKLAPSDYKAIERTQEMARGRAIRGVSGGPGALEGAQAARSAASKVNYRAAFGQQIKADPALIQISKNPYFKSALADADRLAQANKVDPKTGLSEYLHYVKLSLDKQLSRTGDTSLSSAEKAAVNRVKDQVVSWIGKKNPLYEAARARHAELSKPINRMQVGRELEEKLRSPVGDRERATVFAQGVRGAPQTIKKATGDRRFTKLSEILTPEQVGAVKGISLDLLRKAQFDSLAKAGVPSAKASISAQAKQVQGLPILERTSMIINTVLTRVQGKATRKTYEEIAKIMQSPEETAKIMRAATPSERAAFLRVLNEYARVAAIAGPVTTMSKQATGAQ